MQAYRNTGAAFTRADGSRWKRGEVNVPTAEELRRRAYKLCALPDASRIFLHEHPPKARTPLGVEVPERSKFPGWPLEMTPSRYLELYPTGPNAELARTFVWATPKPEAGLEDGTQEEDTEGVEEPVNGDQDD